MSESSRLRIVGKTLFLWLALSLAGVSAPLWIGGLFLYLPLRRWWARTEVRRVLSLAIGIQQKGEHHGTV